jgi:NAD-dependent dihydropyrimidine dehydrogenase PreA subunit
VSALSALGGLVRDVLQTAFRLAPWPTATGLRVVGSPGPDSPVLLTANYDFTVRHVIRALRGCDVWLVVAPAKGINVWCAAGAGHLTTHQVVTALKTSGVADRVNHRDVILPQLAATGVEGLQVFRRARWRVRFGPVRAADIPDYLATGGVKSDAMRRVEFGLRDRLEMAAVWAAPVSLLVGGLTWVFRPVWALPLALLATILAVAVFLVYDQLPGPRQLLLGAGGALASVAVVAVAGGGLPALAAALLAPFALVALLTFDYAGSTPTEGSGGFDGQDWKIRLDPERCEGVYSCFEVCPEAVYEKHEGSRRVELAHDERCVRCGACVVQCPKDALFFEDGQGGRIEPATIRQFKLNLAGKRTVAVPPPPEEQKSA